MMGAQDLVTLCSKFFSSKLKFQLSICILSARVYLKLHKNLWFLNYMKQFVALLV